MDLIEIIEGAVSKETALQKRHKKNLPKVKKLLTALLSEEKVSLSHCGKKITVNDIFEAEAIITSILDLYEAEGYVKYSLHKGHI